MSNLIGKEIYSLAKKLFPINRSITGEGVRETLKIISKIIPSIRIKKVASGTKVYDWIIPQEWQIEEAFIICPGGKKICDFKKNNLHLVGYSIPVNKILSLNDLQEHLFSLPDQINAIPYVTSYYKKSWGFCISQQQRDKLKKGLYKVIIKSKHFKGFLNYGEFF